MTTMKRLCAALLALIMLSLVAATAEGDAIATEEALLAVLADAKAQGLDSVEMQLTQELYDAVYEGYFDRLNVLLVKADMGEYSLRYNTNGYLAFSDIVWLEESAWAECATREEVLTAAAAFYERRVTEFTLLCPPELAQTLKGTGVITACGAQHGVESHYASIDAESGIIQAQQIVYLTVPYALAADETGFREAVTRFAEAGETEFYVVFTPALLARIEADDQLLTLMQASSQLLEYRSGLDERFSRAHYVDVVFSDEPRIVCQSREDIVAAIRDMGAAGADSFALVLTYDLYKALSEDSLYNALQALETEAGMTNGNVSINFSSYALYFSEAEIQADATKLTTLDEVNERLLQSAAAREARVTLFLTPEIYDYLMSGISMLSTGSESMAPIHDALDHAGIYDKDVVYSRPARYIQVDVKAWYPGAAIINALRAQDTSALSSRELETLAAAQAIVGQCAADTPVDTARAIHDYLCRTVTYVTDAPGETEDKSDEHNTAVGAILNGEADCDGYSDAFYLLGTLAGLNVRCQHGDSYSVGLNFDSMNSVTHMWNLLELDGEWVLVDVTWDDEGDVPGYTWFCLGEDRAARTHIWNRDITVPLAPTTDLSLRPGNEYLIAGAGDVDAALSDAAAHGYDRFDLIFADETAAAEHGEALGAASRRASGSFTYSWNERMLDLHFEDIAF